MKKYFAALVLLGPLVLAAQTIVYENVGGTTYDWQADGPVPQLIVNDLTPPDSCIHTIWMYSSHEHDTFPDLNVKYNSYLRGIHHYWNFDMGPAYMNWGVISFPFRAKYDALDVDPDPLAPYAFVTCHAVVDQTLPVPIHPVCTRDHGTGQAVFEYDGGTPVADNYQTPVVGMDGSSIPHIVFTDDGTRGQVWYDKIDPWTNWTSPTHLSVTDPGYPTYSLAVSKQSADLTVSYVADNPSAAPPYPAYYRQSANGGASWDPEVTVPPPPAFTPGSDSTPSFHLAGNQAFYDDGDILHMVFLIVPVVQNVALDNPSEIWHYCPTSNPAWSRVARAGCDPVHLAASVGLNAAYAARPGLALDRAGKVYCVWEQFDSMNVEPTTSRLRADIFAAVSADNGGTWTEPLQVTITNTVSHRFPSVARVADESLHVLYEDDLQAGFWVKGEAGATATQNPIVHVVIPIRAFTSGVAENRIQRGVLAPSLAAAPNPFSGSVRFDYSLAQAGNSALRIYDATGKWVRTLCKGLVGSSAGSVTWDGADFRQKPVARGVYFARLEMPTRTLSRKVVYTP